MTSFATQLLPPADNAPGSRPVAGQPPAFSPGELTFLIGVPLLWAILLLFHPGGEGDEIYLDVQDNVTRFLVVHIGMMIFIPLMAVVVYLLLRGVEGTAAWVSRIALMPFVVFYSAWEVLQGIGVGILANELNGVPQAQAALREDLVQDFAEHALIGPFGRLRQHRKHGSHNRGDRGRGCAVPPSGRARLRPNLARHLGIADHRPPTALRTDRPGPLHHRRPALRAKPNGSPDI